MAKLRRERKKKGTGGRALLPDGLPATLLGFLLFNLRFLLSACIDREQEKRP